mmetsp:Transcript_29367/g.94744  ORF Transcript_29367/g.94744 Transcript_29367/m.94744 type:complete len:357 (+) Transcript_29367:283-1353(+)
MCVDVEVLSAHIVRLDGGESVRVGLTRGSALRGGRVRQGPASGRGGAWLAAESGRPRQARGADQVKLVAVDVAAVDETLGGRAAMQARAHHARRRPAQGDGIPPVKHEERALPVGGRLLLEREAIPVVLDTALQLVDLLEALGLEPGRKILATDAAGAVHHHGSLRASVRVLWQPVGSFIRLRKPRGRRPTGGGEASHIPLVVVSHVQHHRRLGPVQHRLPLRWGQVRPPVGQIYLRNGSWPARVWDEASVLDAESRVGELRDRILLKQHGRVGPCPEARVAEGPVFCALVGGAGDLRVDPVGANIDAADHLAACEESAVVLDDVVGRLHRRDDVEGQVAERERRVQVRVHRQDGR